MPLVSKNFSDIITFTRASTGTYFDSAGVLQSAAIDAPRFDYNPSTLAAQGLLIEEARTNSLLRSAEFDNASWAPIVTKNVTPNTDTAPDGTLTADTVSDSSAAAFQGISQSVTVAADTTTYTASIYVKKTTGGTSATFGLNFQITGGTNVIAASRFNTDTGTVLSGTGSVQNAGSYWRFVVSVTNNGSVGNTTLALSVYPATAAYNSGVDTPTATGSAVIWGAQAEAGAFPTSYIPTTTTALTRSADVASVNTLSPWYNATEGTLFAEATSTGYVLNTGFPLLATFDDGTNNNRITVSQGSSSNSLWVNLRSSAVGTTLADTNVDLSATPAKIAGGFSGTTVSVSVNGQATLSGTTNGVPSGMAGLYLGNRTLYLSALNGYLRRIVYYPRRLSNAELQAITA